AESSLAQESKQTTKNVDSTKFPGQKELTCKLRVPVTGNKEGDYIYRVEVTPDLDRVPSCATVAGDKLPTVTLKQTALYDPYENNLEFDHPESGELALDIHLIGNPEPNRVSLQKRQDETSAMVSLSSQDYRWAYDRTAGAVGGVLKLFITGGLRKDVSTTYILKAENGVLGQDEFEYKFSVGGESKEGNEDGNLFLIVGISAGGVALVLILAIILAVVLRARRSRDERYDVPLPPGARSETNLSAGYLYPNSVYIEEPPSRNPRDASYSDYAEPYLD
ncbi:hypothetical protein PoB_000583400, partial [Plakobranchus ocellatus]